MDFDQPNLPVVLYRVPDPKGGPSQGVGPHVKQNPRKGVFSFLEDPHPRILSTKEIFHT